VLGRGEAAGSTGPVGAGGGGVRACGHGSLRGRAEGGAASVAPPCRAARSARRWCPRSVPGRASVTGRPPG